MSGFETIIEALKLIKRENGLTTSSPSEAIRILYNSGKINLSEWGKMTKLYDSLKTGWSHWDSNEGILLANLMLKAAKR